MTSAIVVSFSAHELCHFAECLGNVCVGVLKKKKKKKKEGFGTLHTM